MTVPEKTVFYFLPSWLHHSFHADYKQARTVVAGLLVAGLSIALLITPLVFSFPKLAYYYFPAASCLASLYIIKRTGKIVLSALLTVFVAYIAIFSIIVQTGGIFSVHVSSLYMLLLTGFRVSRPMGHGMTFVHMLLLILVYMITDQSSNELMTYHTDSKEYYLLFNQLLCIFFATFFSFTQKTQDRLSEGASQAAMAELTAMHQLLERMNKESENARKNIARDYYEETSHIVAAIRHQAAALLKKANDPAGLRVQVAQINGNCEKLLDSSRDYLWSLGQESDNPMVLFDRLADFGRDYFNQCGISFYANPLGDDYRTLFQMDPYACRNVILTFKEAMTNAARHSQATHVKLEMLTKGENVRFILKDNGNWKPIDSGTVQQGLMNMENRCKQNNMIFKILSNDTGTCIEVQVPVARIAA